MNILEAKNLTNFFWEISTHSTTVQSLHWVHCLYSSISQINCTGFCMYVLAKTLKRICTLYLENSNLHMYFNRWKVMHEIIAEWSKSSKRPIESPWFFWGLKTLCTRKVSNVPKLRVAKVLQSNLYTVVIYFITLSLIWIGRLAYNLWNWRKEQD